VKGRRLGTGIFASQFSRSVGVLVGGTGLGQIVLLVTMPWVTRLYSPEEMGLWVAYLAVAQSLVVVSSFRLDLAIPLARDDAAAALLVILCFHLLLLFSGLVTVGAFLFGGSAAIWAGLPQLTSFMWLLPPIVIAGGAYQILTLWAVRQQTFRRIAQWKLGQTTSQVLAQIIGGLLQVGPGGLILGTATGNLVGTAGLSMAAIPSLKEARAMWSRSLGLSLLRRYRRFPQLLSIAALANTAAMQLPVLLLASLYTPVAAGLFALGHRVVGVPLSLIGQAMGQVYLGRAAELRRTDPTQLRPLFLRISRKLLLSGGIPIACLAIGGPWVFAFVFGESWLTAGQYVQVLAPMLLIQFAVVPLAQTLTVLERQDLQLGWDLARLIFVVGAIVLSKAYGGTALSAVIAYSVTMSVAYCIYFGMTLLVLSGKHTESHDL
jgi:O-antigen/teichoic acid export membrane protein